MPELRLERPKTIRDVLEPACAAGMYHPKKAAELISEELGDFIRPQLRGAIRAGLSSASRGELGCPCDSCAKIIQHVESEILRRLGIRPAVIPLFASQVAALDDYQDGEFHA